ncbi:ced-6 [Carabus blaptoides fortunei]
MALVIVTSHSRGINNHVDAIEMGTEHRPQQEQYKEQRFGRADGVAIQEPRTHVILHQFPLHRISYCADDKGEKKFFSFIAKQSGQENEEEKHECFVFISDKLAEEITLTIGQAFELAYRRFLDTSGKDLESQRRAMVTQQRIKRLEQEVNVYKKRLLDVSQFAAIQADLDQYLRKQELKNILEVPAAAVNGSSINDSSSSLDSDHVNGNKLVDLMSSSAENGAAPPVPPRHFENQPTVGTKLEGLLLNEVDSDQDFDPRGFESSSSSTTNHSQPSVNGSASSPPLLAPPPKAAKRNNVNNNGSATPTFGQDLFGSTPFSPQPSQVTTPPSASKSFDPFEMGDFSPTATPQDIENAIGLLDKRILEMKTGFSRGISFGNDDFSLESLDPLKN